MKLFGIPVKVIPWIPVLGLIGMIICLIKGIHPYRLFEIGIEELSILIFAIYQLTCSFLLITVIQYI